MSALPNEPTPRATYADPHRLEADEGPQNLAELRAALAVIDPAALAAFNARYDAATFGRAQAEILAQARRSVAFSRPEVMAAIRASLDGTAEPRPVEELWAHLDGRDSAA
ncbi:MULTISPECIES: hypothetical protein [unclassified Streptomyces]|uniref:hypothetical protein n=1 Tax=unclassified Streptomyces TaxID=2593676 RepID=UPI0033F58418